MVQIKFLPLKELTSFLYWWSVLMPVRIFKQTQGLLIALDESLMLGRTIRLWIAVEPLFGDYTKGGRLVGFFLRSVRIVFSLGAYLAVFIGGIGLFLIWYATPILAIIYLFK